MAEASGRRAAIDLGSNSALLTVVDAAGRPLRDEARVVGLGKGLGDGGRFRPDRRDAALAVLSDYASAARALGVEPGEVRAVATSSARRASDAADFFAEVEARTGLRFRVISGEEEARLTFAGGLSGLRLEGEVAVIDLGGGSTEIALGEGALRWKHSYEIGSVRLTEAVLGDPARPATPGDLAELEARARAVFADPRPDGRPAVAVGVAGSVTTLAATALGLLAWDGARVHGSRLTDAELAGFQRRLLGADADARRAVFPVSPERADFLLAGATVLRAALASLGLAEMVVSERGLRYGLLGDAR